MTEKEILETVHDYNVKHVLLTGGEPLLQRNSPALARSLHDQGYQVSIETHGEISIAPVAAFARIIMDIKTPSSGMSRGGFRKNFPLLKKTDEVKFVIASEQDYFWAREIVRENQIKTEEILLSPAVPALGSPGKFPQVKPLWLAERILEDKLPVRLQLQLHKLLWGADKKGV